jgi:hypothetical protein
MAAPLAENSTKPSDSRVSNELAPEFPHPVAAVFVRSLPETVTPTVARHVTS